MILQNPIFPAKAGIQIQPELWKSLAPLSRMIWAPAFAGEAGEGTVNA